MRDGAAGWPGASAFVSDRRRGSAAPWGRMARVNLSPARLAVLVALVVSGVAITMNGFGDEGTAVADGSGEVVEPTDLGVRRAHRIRLAVRDPEPRR